MNAPGKLQRGTLSLDEAYIIADLLGYELEFIDKYLFYRFHIAECQRRILEQTVGDLPIDNPVHHRAYAFFRILFQTAGGSFDRIRHHQYRRFFGKRIRTGIGEVFFIDGPVGILILKRVVEVFRLAASVMRADEIDNRLWE